MGRSVNSVTDAVSVVYYDVSHHGLADFACGHQDGGERACDECGEDERRWDEDIDRNDWDWFIENLQAEIVRRWPSFEAVDGHSDDGGELTTIAVNGHARIVVSHSAGIASLSLASLAESHLNTGCDGCAALANLADHWTARVSPRFVADFGDLARVGGCSDGTSLYTRNAA